MADGCHALRPLWAGVSQKRAYTDGRRAILALLHQYTDIDIRISIGIPRGVVPPNLWLGSLLDVEAPE